MLSIIPGHGGREGIVLEVGGMLRHGAIIAREYGKPCIAGTGGILEKFTDGRMVEVDGASGSVRFPDKKPYFLYRSGPAPFYR